MAKIFQDSELGSITLSKSLRSNRLKIRVHPTNGISVIIPVLVSYEKAVEFFMSNRARVIAALERQKQAGHNRIRLSRADAEAIKKPASAVLPRKTAILAQRYGFKYNRLALKNNKSNWGSCCGANINLNINLVRLPEILCDYVILHELCHLRHHNHGPEFHALLNRLCEDNLNHLLNKYEGKPIAEERKEEYQTIKKVEETAAKSRSKEPYRYSIEKMIKKYTLV